MISFFRKIRRLLISEKKFSRYLLYAAGEILLVMIGILLALQVNNWNEYRKERIEEDKILREINRNLVIDIEEIDHMISLSQNNFKRIETLLNVIKQDSIIEKNEMDSLFGAVHVRPQFQLNTSPFKTLNSKGINIISNDSLKSTILNVYEVWNRRLEHSSNVQYTVTAESVIPYYLEHFKEFKITRTSIPIDFEKVINDNYYENIVEYRLSMLLLFIYTCNVTQSEMIKLNEMIDKHFGEN